MAFRFIKGWHIVYNLLGIKVKKQFTPRHYNKLNLIFPDEAGIGNRIFGLINYINYTNPQTVNIYWSDKGWVSSKFSDIFDYSHKFELNEYSSDEEVKDWGYKWSGNETEITVNFPPVNLKSLEGKELRYDKVTDEEFNKYSVEFHNLKPSKQVTERIKTVDLPEKFVSLQVRNSADWDAYGRNEALEFFFKEIEKYPQDTKFYLSAMDLNISSEFTKKYGDRIIELPDKDYKSMTDAMADLYIMSYADRAIYSYGSTFGELAFWLSDKKQQVTVIGNGNGWK